MLDIKYILPLVTIVENSCLMHDIGNPSFAHFGEAAIRSWFKKNGSKIIKEVEMASRIPILPENNFHIAAESSFPILSENKIPHPIGKKIPEFREPDNKFV